MIAALLLGREKSVGFPGKNWHPVLGRPLCAYPLMAARHARTVDRVFVSTDSEKIKAAARAQGAEIIERPPELATKESLGESAYVHGYRVIQEKFGRPELVVLLFCNAATILADTIDEGVRALRADASRDSAVTVSVYNMWSPLRARRLTGEGLLQPFVPFEVFGDPATLNCDRDSQGDVYFADMSMSVVRPQNLEDLSAGLLPQKWMGRRIFPVKQWGGCDVDYRWQLPGVEDRLREHGFSETATPYGEGK